MKNKLEFVGICMLVIVFFIFEASTAILLLGGGYDTYILIFSLGVIGFLTGSYFIYLSILYEL